MIEVVTEKTLDEILPLVRAYREFCKEPDIADTINIEFFKQFGAGSPSGCQFLFREAGKAVGFATVFITFDSLIPAKIGMLHDLYTLETERGNGVGKQLIEQARTYAHAQGAQCLQWLTGIDNHRAQRLYDRLGAKKSAWYLYGYNTV